MGGLRCARGRRRRPAAARPGWRVRLCLYGLCSVGLALAALEAAAEEPATEPALSEEQPATGAVPTPGQPAATPVPAGSACADSMAERVQAYYDRVRDLRARFTQTTSSVAFGSAPGASETAEGEVAFAKPGRMRWSYEAPEPSLVVSDGEVLWIHDILAGEVQKLPVGPEFLSGAGIQFLLGSGRILETFRVEASDCGAESVGLALHPREPAPYERIDLRVERATGAVQESRVTDLFQNQTLVAFRSVEINPGLPDAVFRFVPPEGVRVIALPEAP